MTKTTKELIEELDEIYQDEPVELILQALKEAKDLVFKLSSIDLRWSVANKAPKDIEAAEQALDWLKKNGFETH